MLSAAMPRKGGGPAESPAQSTITASRPRAKMANGDSSRIHRYLRLPPHEAKFLSQMKGVESETHSRFAGGRADPTSIEQAGHRFFRGGAADRLADQRGDGQDP